MYDSYGYGDPWAEFLVLMLAFLGIIFVLAVIAYVLTALGLMKMFQKVEESGTGEKVPGWKAWVPFLNIFEMYRLVWDVKFFAITVGLSVLAGFIGQGRGIIFSLFSFLISIAIIILQIVLAQLTAKAFGKGTGFAVGLFFVPMIMYLILGFGEAKYLGNKYEHEIFGMKINF